MSKKRERRTLTIYCPSDVWEVLEYLKSKEVNVSRTICLHLLKVGDELQRKDKEVIVFKDSQ